MRIAIIHNKPGPLADASESSVGGQGRSIERALREAGYDTELFAAGGAAELMDFLRRDRPDLIFNCCESLQGQAAYEMNVAAMIELLGIPFTGSPALTLGLCLNKAMAKAMLAAGGIATPAWVVAPVHHEADISALQFPLIVKPVAEDASLGVDVNSVVRNAEELRARIQFVWERFGPAIVEEFIPGREFNVALLASSPGCLLPLPISEIVFVDLPDPLERIVTYEAKWVEESTQFRATVPKCPAEVDDELADTLRRISLAAAAAVQLGDYGRVDLRVRSDGQVFVLEVNPNPDISADSGFARAAAASGRTHAATVVEIAERAMERGRQQAATPKCQ